ncbi:MAG: LuxR C-terminal-related transcriptional regulator [Anaerolineae bacterium]
MREPLLATKLHTPPLRSDLVSRQRLLDRLDSGLRRKLTLVSAPAGFGKTTLLGEWQASPQGQSLSLAWVLLDEQDNDPVRFWGYVLAALERACPGCSPGAEALLHGLSPRGTRSVAERSEPMRSVLTALVNDLVDALVRPLILVLDDYHTINSPAIHDMLAFLINYLPASAHVAILTRADPPLPLARLRARGELLELRAADLRFTDEEAELFLNRAMALDLPADAVSTLDARTEGWAAGLKLAALSLQGLDRAEARRFVDAFEGTHRHVLTYLTEEVLLRQSPEEQTFLLQTSILPYLTAPLCDAVMDRPGSQATLERLANDNLFTTPLDRKGEWYRYLPLFADTLRARLQADSPDLLPILHRRASAWHQEHGAVGDAVRHALDAGDSEYAADLVEEGYKRLVMRGELVTLHRWLDALPAHLVESRPRLGLAYALALAYSDRREVLERRLEQAEAALAAAPQMADADVVRGEIAAFRAVFASVHWAGVCSLDLSRQALRLLPAARNEEELWLRTLILQARGNCQRFQGQVREAEQNYAEALAAARALDSPFLVQAITNRIGQNQLLQGQLRRAAQTFEAALRRAEARGGELLWLSGELHAHLGQIYAEWNELDRALQHIRQCIELSRQAENHLALVEGYQALAEAQAARGQTEDAALSLDQAQELAGAVGVPYLNAQVAARQAWLGLGPNGDAVSAAHVQQWAETWTARRSREINDDVPPVLHEFQDLILARFWLQQGQIDGALRVLAEIEPSARAAGRMGRVVQALLLRALIHQEQNEPGRAAEALGRALALAEPEGYVRTFLDLGRSLHPLLADLRTEAATLAGAASNRLAYLDRLLAALAEPGRPTADAQGLLTPRELEILTLMAGGASNQEIAQRLVVTVGTVKGHVNHILDKLEAHNRTAAVARARELGLLND